ncbi:patatin-like phospholipase family protein [Glaciimonas immobilis]|uniref:NTE family protein n=1 Tax=Glaciimonas immobilis TaxID=728004 RepID=A0A840RXI7_9BURK|nr:patatin-like phospholipase family protein [Glaciimonas immobilis]KAF3997239.1 patatin-like phospholipase family protein [Glaciimonas immobilis]MBB5202293.1 NTE family protein [Glaciimonas immobilis]
MTSKVTRKRAATIEAPFSATNAASAPPIKVATPSEAKVTEDPAVFKPRIVLVLQGGGALGAYQAGVYQAMHEHNMTPDWVVGTSIGAINAAIIAGNSRDLRLSRLKEFWDSVSHNDLVDMAKVPDAVRKSSTWWTTVDTVLRGVPGFFKPRPLNPFALGLPVEPERASFYDTSPLSDTLTRLLDLDFLNCPDSIRLTVSAMKVTSGELVCFDSEQRKIGVEHVMASGALPPGFAPVRVDGDLYWDGGLYSNTPLEIVLDDQDDRPDKPRVDTICVMVDLWSAEGDEPRTLDEVETRQKDVTFASRSQRHIDNYLLNHQLRRTARALYDKLPVEERSKADMKQFAGLADTSTIHLVRLRYSGHDWNMASKDVNFSRGSVTWRWDQGYQDALKAIKNANLELFGQSDAGLVIHDLIEIPA